MSRRTTRGKPTLETILLGDRPLAQRMADALAVEEVDDRGTHGFHTYPAGLHPDAARDLLACFPGDSLLDPFCGGGTVLVEGRIGGRRTVGVDLNPTALRVARARTATPDDETLTRFRSKARRLTDSAKNATVKPPEPIAKAVAKWYAPYVVQELEALRQGVLAADDDIRPFLEAVLSSILIKVSWRRSDTNPERVKHKRPKNTAAILFHKKARELARRMVALRELVPEGTPHSDLRLGDARRVTVDEPVELVLTSPPYPATYDYLPIQHLRKIWMGDQPAEEHEIGARRSWREGSRDARGQWAEATAAWTKAAADALAPGGRLVVVIGDGLTPSGPIDSSYVTEEAAKAAGLKSLARASLERPDYARDTARWEHVFAFERP